MYQKAIPMKTARHPKTHDPIPTSADAPKQALCPHCNGVVVLRCRK
ncbi:MAG: hypothetical protein H6665_00045 [Ardenticatenaceae bacterium]|nr:hypothetical protein [Ardenticatenaceae bacterium]